MPSNRTSPKKKDTDFVFGNLFGDKLLCEIMLKCNSYSSWNNIEKHKEKKTVMTKPTITTVHGLLFFSPIFLPSLCLSMFEYTVFLQNWNHILCICVWVLS